MKKNDLISLVIKSGLMSSKRLFDDHITIVEVNKENIDYIFYTSNNILHIKGDVDGFLRPCRFHTKSANYYKESVKIYSFWKNLSAAQENELLTVLNDPERFHKILNMGQINDEKSALAEYMRSNDLAAIGFDKLSPSLTKSILPDFLQYIWSELFSYKISRNRRTFQTFPACKTLAYERLSKMLGLNFVPESKPMKLIVEDHVSYGVFMQNCEGKTANECTKEKIMHAVSPQLQKELMELNILDSLCLEKDHGPNNYKIRFDESGKAAGIGVFDNDSAYSFFPTPSVSFSTYSGCPPIIRDGRIARRFFPKELSETILTIQDKEISKQLRPFLNRIQCMALKTRIHKLQSAILKSKKENPEIFLDQSEWNDQTVGEELQSGIKTYLKLLTEWLD